MAVGTGLLAQVCWQWRERYQVVVVCVMAGTSMGANGAKALGPHLGRLHNITTLNLRSAWCQKVFDHAVSKSLDALAVLAVMTLWLRVALDNNIGAEVSPHLAKLNNMAMLNLRGNGVIHKILGTAVEGVHIWCYDSAATSAAAWPARFPWSRWTCFRPCGPASLLCHKLVSPLTSHCHGCFRHCSCLMCSWACVSVLMFVSA